ncbi:MAG: twin transmembrane helix small protein [Mangrovicoccus sp.]
MANDPLFILVAVACLSVAVILLLGVGVFSKGGELNKKYGNKLMRYRLIAQAVAVALILLFVLVRQMGAS